MTLSKAIRDLQRSLQRSGKKKVRNWITRCLTSSAGFLNYQEYETFLRQALSWICWNRCIEKVPGPYAPSLMMIYHDKNITSTNSKEYNHPQKPTDSALCAILTPQRRPCSFPRVFVENLVTLLVRPARVRLSKARLQHFKLLGNFSDFGVPKICGSCLYNRTFKKRGGGWWFS